VIHARKDYDRIQDPEGKIPDDEPVFLIRGQDAVGAEVVREWARLNDEAGGDKRLSDMADEHADKMARWRVHKLADAPEEVFTEL
jgi:hypothetical protein